jgi:hypothetical protein
MQTNTFTWQKISIPDWPLVQKELQDLATTIRLKRRIFTPLVRDQVNQQILAQTPRLAQYLAQNRLDVWAAGWVNLQPNQSTPPHIDIYCGSQIQPILALQLPLQGCDSSTTHIYQSKTDPDHYKRSLAPNWTYDPLDLTVIDSYQLSEPILFNIKTIHQVINGSEPRLALSLRFEQDPWHLITK